MIGACCNCHETRKIHAHSRCKRCYNRSRVAERKVEQRRHYLKHRAKINAKTKAYYWANRDRCREQQREYRNRGVAGQSYGADLVRVAVKGWGVRA